MKLILGEPRFLKDSIGVVSELVSEVQIRVKDDNLEIIAMDPANVAMVVFRLLSSAFVEYNVEGEKILSVNLDSFKHVLRRAKSSDTVVLELDEDKNKLKIQLRGDNVRTFNLGLIDIEEKEQKVPDLKFEVNIEMNSVIFDEAIEDMDIISDAVVFEADEGKFILGALGNVNEGRVVFENGEDISIMFEGDALKAKYSLEYLKKIVKGGRLSDKVRVSFSRDYPLKVEYMVRDKLQLSTILAPRGDSS